MKTNIKNEMTVDSIVNLINQQNYTIEQLSHNVITPYRFKNADFNFLCKTFLDYYFHSYTDQYVELDDVEFYGATIKLNEKITRVWINDMYRITFNRMYPNIMSKLWKEKKLSFNIFEFGIIFSFMVDHFDDIKNHKDITEVGKYLFRFFINYTYGAGVSKSSMIKISKIEYVVNYAKHVLLSIFMDYPEIVFYMDTDQIYLDYPLQDIIDRVNSLEIPFIVDSNINGMFFQLKKYMTEENGIIKKRGLYEYKSKYKFEKDRINKVKKIRKIIRSVN